MFLIRDYIPLHLLLACLVYPHFNIIIQQLSEGTSKQPSILRINTTVAVHSS